MEIVCFPKWQDYMFLTFLAMLAIGGLGIGCMLASQHFCGSLGALVSFRDGLEVVYGLLKVGMIFSLEFRC